MTPSQCKAARDLLGWSQEELTDQSAIGLSTIKKIEMGKDVKQSSLDSLEYTFTKQGIVFLDGGDVSLPTGEGVYLKHV